MTIAGDGSLLVDVWVSPPVPGTPLLAERQKQMSRELPEDFSDWDDDDKRYAAQRPWITQHPDGSPDSGGSDDDVTFELTEDMVRDMNKEDVLALFDDPALANDLADVDKNQNKEPLVDDVVAALFGDEA